MTDPDRLSHRLALGGAPPVVDTLPRSRPIGPTLVIDGDTFGDLSNEAASLLASSSVEVSGGDAWSFAVLCPAGTTFDAAEALRLELVARAPAGVVVDVQIAPASPGALSSEDEAGVRLFELQRAERLAPKPPALDDPFPWDEPAFGFDVSALLGAPVAPSAEDLAASLSKAAGEPVEVRDVRIEGSALHCTVTMSRDLAADLDLVPVSGREVVRDALLARLRDDAKDEPEGSAS